MAITVGTACTPNAWATCELASKSIEASRNLPAYSVDSLVSSAPSALEPRERGDHSSTTTGAWRDRSITSAWKFASVTSSTYAPPPGAPPAAAPGAPGAPGAAPAGLRRDDRSTAPGREKLDWLTTALAFRAYSACSQTYPLRR